MTALTEVVWGASGIVLALALVLTAFRLLAGPVPLDRMIALDTLSAIGQCALGLYVAWTRDTTVAPAIMALALVSFLGPVAVARFRIAYIRREETQS